jgi:hypothetical protein
MSRNVSTHAITLRTASATIASLFPHNIVAMMGSDSAGCGKLDIEGTEVV